MKPRIKKIDDETVEITFPTELVKEAFDLVFTYGMMAGASGGKLPNLRLLIKDNVDSSDGIDFGCFADVMNFISIAYGIGKVIYRV